MCECFTQQKVNFVDSRLHSAEHSSELDALHSLARELRVFYAKSRDCLSHNVRVFDAIWLYLSMISITSSGVNTGMSD